jgi:hypothetical protein
VASFVSWVKLSVPLIPPMGWQQIRRNEMDMIQFEEAHTELLRNCKAFEGTNICKVAYAVCRIDDEYGYKVLSKVLFTMNDAFEYACKTAPEYKWGDYSDFLLVENLDDWYAMGGEARRGWDYMEVAIYEYVDGSEQDYPRQLVFGKRTPSIG